MARRDVAAVAAELLVGEGHDGKTYDVTGRESVSFAEDRQHRRRAATTDETLDEAYASRAGYGAPDWQVEAWVTTYLGVARGELDVVTDTVKRLTGHEPVTLAEFIREGDRPPRG